MCCLKYFTPSKKSDSVLVSLLELIVFLYFSFNSTIIANSAVIQSIKRVCPKSITFNNRSAIAGDKILIDDEAVAWIRFIFVTFSAVTSSGKKACSNGVFITEHTDINEQAPYRRYNQSKPFINKIASINVEIPVIVSPIIIRFFLLNLSPHVPENIEITICGI